MHIFKDLPQHYRRLEFSARSFYWNKRPAATKLTGLASLCLTAIIEYIIGYELFYFIG
ncbi:hypothetical protein Vi05172_g11985 [Venturia inaequalis]|nr:hypothetical protein Vi05172_g11985 [Venturia inaequalis]